MTSKKLILILAQDECAPDAAESFRKDFELTFGKSFDSFYEGVLNSDVDPEYGTTLAKDGIIAMRDAGSPFWEIRASSDIAWRYLLINEIKCDILNHIGWLEKDAKIGDSEMALTRISILTRRLKDARKTIKKLINEKPDNSHTEGVSGKTSE